MKPEFIPHQTYQDFVFAQLNEHYSNGILFLLKNDWPTIKKLWLADLSVTTSWLYNAFSNSNKGSYPIDPASMMRSYLLSLMIQPAKGLTHWVDQLRRVPLYAILSGFEPGCTPGVGTFYDFFDRIWASDEANMNSKIRLKRKKKNKKKKLKREKRKLQKILVLLKSSSIASFDMIQNKNCCLKIHYSFFFNHTSLKFQVNMAYSEIQMSLA